MTTKRSLVWTLGLGAFGLAFSITVTRAYLPPLLKHFTSSATIIAAVIAAEGLFALTLPLVVGPWSDTFHTPLGRRRPFMLVALGPMGCAAYASGSSRRRADCAPRSGTRRRSARAWP